MPVSTVPSSGLANPLASTTTTTSTITTLNAPSGVLATQNGMTGIPKAWVNFTPSSGAVNGSFNVSSVTRASTGNYTLNFTTAMANANYACSMITAGAGNGVVCFTQDPPFSTSSLAVFSKIAAGSNFDAGVATVIVCGT